MNDVVSIAEVQQAGVAIEADEAVAIAQQLIAGFRQPDVVQIVEAPFGPPTAQNVYVSADGRAMCRACETTPAVSEMAIFLQSLLLGPVHVPGGLRYTLARALLDVDVPPFDSLDDFSETLARYERGPRAQAVRRVHDRLHGRRALVPVGVVERRRRSPPTELRRALREADKRLYLQKVASCASLVVVPPPQPARRSSRAAAGFIAAGLAMIAFGEFVDLRDAAVTLPRVAPIAAVESKTVEPRTSNPERRIPNPERRIPNPESRIPSVEPRPSRASGRPELVEGRTPNPVVKGVARPSRASISRARPHKASRGVFDRLRLGWLRNAFTFL
jgi:hypothetical protein